MGDHQDPGQDQYESDLAQALALSLETHAIESIRRQGQQQQQQQRGSPQTWSHPSAGELPSTLLSLCGYTIDNAELNSLLRCFITYYSQYYS